MTAVVKGFDPECRYRRVLEHLCVTNKGDPVPVGGTCFVEARHQIEEQGAVLHAAERAVTA